MARTTTIAMGLFLTAIAGAAHAEPMTKRMMEPVLTISAQQTEMLLADENIVFISSSAAEALLGDPNDTAMSIDLINNMPATAAGNDEILFISADAAESLLGDPN